MRKLLLVIAVQVSLEGEEDCYRNDIKIEEMFHTVIIVRGKTIGKTSGIDPSLKKLSLSNLPTLRQT